MSSKSPYVPPSRKPVLPPTKAYVPQLSNGEMAMLISQNQPWKDRDEIEADVRHEQLRQRLWNGYGQ